jgi:hypothetical protein
MVTVWWYAARSGIQESMNQVGQEVTRRNVNVQPTLTIPPRFALRVTVTMDLVLRPYQPLFFSEDQSNERVEHKQTSTWAITEDGYGQGLDYAATHAEIGARLLRCLALADV